jgi:hypothetical protein
MDPMASARAALKNWTGLAPAKSGESMGRVREDSTADLEVGVEVGEADSGGVLQRAVRLAPALQRRHCCLRGSAAAPRLPPVSVLASHSLWLCASRPMVWLGLGA